jgi:transposase
MAMRGDDANKGSVFSYIDLEKRVSGDHPLRLIREIANAALKLLSRDFDALYSPIGRESIPPERRLRALLLQAFYWIRSERQLVERIDYDLLFRWFVGLGIEDPVWDATSFTKNRDRLLDGEVASKFLAAVLAHDKVRGLLSSEHFSVASISRLTERCWRRGPARRASARRTAAAPRPAGGATASATFAASAGATTRTPRPPIAPPGCSARGRARKRGCASSGTH